MIYFSKFGSTQTENRTDFYEKNYNEEEIKFLAAKGQKSITGIALHSIAAVITTLYSLLPVAKAVAVDGVLTTREVKFTQIFNTADKRKTGILALALTITAIAHAYFHFRYHSPKELQLQALRQLCKNQLGPHEFTLFKSADSEKIYLIDRQCMSEHPSLDATIEFANKLASDLNDSGISYKFKELDLKD